MFTLLSLTRLLGSCLTLSESSTLSCLFYVVSLLFRYYIFLTKVLSNTSRTRLVSYPVSMPAINISVSWHHIYRFYLITCLMLKACTIGRLDYPRRGCQSYIPPSVIFTFGVNPTLPLPCLAKSRERKPRPSSKCPSITYKTANNTNFYTTDPKFLFAHIR